MVQERLDYCNSLLYSTSNSNINKLQRLQNSLARIVTGTRRREHITPALARLHWLPVRERINYKLSVITFNVLTAQQPSYLSDLLRLRVSSRQLRSSCLNLLHVDRTKLKFADRAFRYAAPYVWNSLPSTVTSDLSSFATFRRRLKTVLYSRAFR